MNIYVIDHHPLVAESLARMLRNICIDGRVTALERLSQLQAAATLQGEPDVVLIDLWGPGIRGHLTVANLREQYPSAAIVVLSDVAHEPLERACQTAGASLFLNRDVKLNAFYQRLSNALQAHFPARAAQIHSKPVMLTLRQIQILYAIENGATNSEMAKMLGLSPHTIKVHLWRMFQRFGVNSRLQLLRYAYDRGMV